MDKKKKKAIKKSWAKKKKPLKLKTARKKAKKFLKLTKISKAKTIKKPKTKFTKKVKKLKRKSTNKKFPGIKKKKKILKPKEHREISQNKNFFKAKIRVIGIGGGGGSIVSEIGRSLSKASFVVADTDARSFKKRRGIKQFLFGREVTHGLGTGLNTELAKMAAEQEKEKITKLFDGQDIVILIASLGGGLGSGASQVFAEISRNFGGVAFGIFTLPFRFEGKNKYNIAQKSLVELRKNLDVSLTIPNERIFKVIDENTAITQAFSLVNKNLVASLESLIDLIYNPGVINIDFADLKAVLKGKGNLAFINTVYYAGKDRAEKTSEHILKNPLYYNGNFTAEKILFNIAGPSNLSMLEVDKISRQIAEQNPKAKIIFGISKSHEGKNRIKTTLLMVGPEKGRPTDIKKAKTEKESAVKKDEKPKKPEGKKTNNKPKTKSHSQKPPKQSEPKITLPVFQPRPENALVKALQITGQEKDAQKTIRRNALQVKELKEQEEAKKSKQEEEWEIPAFLRLKK